MAYAGRSSEYKHVTVLFADVVRSMDIAAALDIERFREVMTGLVAALAQVLSRYGATVEYNGDGVMALFGAPLALEDHAFRACLAALAVQEEGNRIAAEVMRRDGVAVQLRVGMNSGRVIAGDTGSGSLGYRAIGQDVGMAQRMESAAPPGGVMLSDSTARLVEHQVMLAEPDWVSVKGFNERVRGHRLLAIGPRDKPRCRTEASLVGRQWEMAALDAMAERAVSGRGGVVSLVGPPGIGKSRVAREAANLAAGHGMDVVWTFCESHAREVAFHAVIRLLRAGLAIVDADGDTARTLVRQRIPEADSQDLLLLDDLLGISDPAAPVLAVDPDTRRRRLTALVTEAALAREQPTLFVVEDAHWMDAASEAMLTEFLSVISRTASMVLITSRPECTGALLRAHGAQTITLASLDDSDIAALLGELLGSDTSVLELTKVITRRAAGNPFFAEEMMRELVQRGVLSGERGEYRCRTAVAEVSVPETVAAAIEARIDRLSATARRTINAASVIGARFDAQLLGVLGVDADLGELISAEMVDRVRFAPHAEYAFRHPLIRAVAYESQLKSQRSQWHRQLVAALQERSPDCVEDNAALIAEHLEAAGDQRAAYAWHMRAAAWLTNRDVAAARLSWERALRIGDALPRDDPNQLSMRIAPRTMLCATDYDKRVQENQSRFEELRALCDEAGDKVSLAIGMSQVIVDLAYMGRSPEGARLATEQADLLESIGDPNLTLGLAFVGCNVWGDAGDFDEILRRTQTVIDLAAGDPVKGAGFGFGSPLAIALGWRSTACWWLGRPGWRRDLNDALAMARDNDPATFAALVAWTYNLAIDYGVLRADDAVVRTCEGAVRAAGSSHDIALRLAEYALAVALLSRDAVDERERGLDLMVQFRGFCQQRAPFLVPVADVWTAREAARRGDRDSGIDVMREAIGALRSARRIGYGLWGTGVLVETLLERGAKGDLAEAEDAVGWLTDLFDAGAEAAPTVTLLRLRALLAHARGAEAEYCDYRDRYRDMAKALELEGHIDWAETMP